MVRVKNRYILFQIQWENDQIIENLNEAMLFTSIRQLVEFYYGSYGVSSTNMSGKKETTFLK